MNTIELVTDDNLETRLYECLKQRCMPDYFLYAGAAGTRNWINLEKSEEFPIASRLTDLLRQNAPAIARHLTPTVSLVSIGVGDGSKERILLEELIKHGMPRYCAIDISGPMVDTALANISDLDIKATGIVAFCDDLPKIHSQWKSPTLLCLLGNNFCNYEPCPLFELISKEMTQEDHFLFDCHVVPIEQLDNEEWRREVETAYRSQPNVLFNISPLIRHGLMPDDCVFELDLAPEDTPFGRVLRTRKHIRILSDAELCFGEKTLHLASGDIINLGFTYKYTAQAIGNLLRQNGFRVIESFASASRDNILILANTTPQEES